MSATTIVKTANGTAIAVNGIVIDPSGATLNQVLSFNGTSFVPATGGGGGGTNYQTIKNSAGTAQTQRTALEFNADFALTDDGTNTVVALNPVVTGATSGGGAVYVNSITYNSKGQITAITTGTPAGGGGVDTTLAYTWTGVHTHSAAMTWGTDNTYSFGDATHRALNLYTTAVRSGASQLLVNSAIANGTTSAIVFDTTNAFSGNRVYDFKTGGFSMMDLWTQGGGVYLELNRADTGAQVGYFLWGASYIAVSHVGGMFKPNSDNTMSNGDVAGNKWKQVAAYQYTGVEQTIPAATNLTINPTLGEHVRVTLGVSISTITVSAGQPGQILTMSFIQDATGGRTMPSGANWTNMKLAGGGFSNTATALKRDELSARWDATNNTWVEIGRANNL